MRYALTRVINLLRRIRKLASTEFMNGYVVLRFVVALYEAHITNIEKGVDPCKLIFLQIKLFLISPIPSQVLSELALKC